MTQCEKILCEKELLTLMICHAHHNQERHETVDKAEAFQQCNKAIHERKIKR